MAVVFYVDPAMAKDSDGADVNTITLSYTFYPLRAPQRTTQTERRRTATAEAARSPTPLANPSRR